MGQKPKHQSGGSHGPSEAQRSKTHAKKGRGGGVPFCDEDFPLEHRALVHKARESWVAEKGAFRAEAIVATVEAEDYAAADYAEANATVI